MLKRAYFYVIIYFLATGYIQAQTHPQYIFTRITKNEGLASNTTFQVVRDKQGYLWIATQNGLQRYDGNRFVTFQHTPGRPSSIPKNGVSHLFIDSKDRLWVAFDRVLGIFNTVDFSFTKTAADSTIVMIRKITEDAEGHIILFADSKQFVYDEKKGDFTKKYEFPSLAPGFAIGDMTLDPSGKFYWFTGRQGSFLYNPSSKQFSYAGRNSSGERALDSIGSIKNVRYPFIDKDGSWWFVNWIPFTGPAPVLYHYDRKRNRLEKFEKLKPYINTETYYEIWNIFQQSNGTIWISGMGLLAYYSPLQNRFIQIASNPFQQNGIDYDFVSGLYEDREKNVWVTTNKGVYRFNTDAQVFETMSNRRYNDTTIARNAVSSILQTQNNGIWVSTWGAGVFSYNDRFQPIPNPVMESDPTAARMHASSMIQRKNGEIWMGTQSGDLKIFQPSLNTTTTLRLPVFNGETITEMLEDGAGNTWIGTVSGILVKCEKGNWKDTTGAYKKVLADAGDIMKLFEDNMQHLWVGTASNGVYELSREDARLLKHYMETTDDKSGLLSDGASDIVQYNDSTLLFASDKLCILNLRTRVFRYLTAADGLPPEQITTLTLDRNKRLWVALDGGLYRLNLDNNLYVSYDATDGITSNVFQVSGSTLLRDGRIAMGTPRDFVVFDPEKAINRNEPPPVVISGFTLGNSSLSVDSIQKLEELKLSYDNTFLSIRVSTLNFREQYYMYYMLEELDNTWKQVQNAEIVYQYLPPGNYTLKLISKNSEGIVSKTTKTLRIEVKPPFWKSWWFYSLLGLLVGVLLFWIDHVRINRKTAILKMRSDIADGLHQDINAALNNITILSEIARMKADREPEKSKEFIEQIHLKSQNMVFAMDDILWSIDPDNDSMANFMTRFREYVHALKNQNNVQIDVLVDRNAENLQLKMKMRSGIFSIFKSGIRNMVKVGAKNCRIHIAYDKPNLVYTLEFDTAGMDMAALHNLRQRKELVDKLEELNARLVFEERKANAFFLLTIPVKNTGF